jgi:hypothetical protein
MHLADTPEQRAALKDLVEAYPGTLIYQNFGTGFNAVRQQYERLTSAPHSRYIVEFYIRHMEDLSARMKQAFPDGRFEDGRKMLDNDVTWMKAAFAQRYSPES